MKGVSFSRREILFLRSNDICRVATCNNNVPHVTPVSYIFDDVNFYFATDYNTVKYANLKKNNTISLVVDITENKKNMAIFIMGTTYFIHKGKRYEKLYDMFYDRFDWVKNEPWRQGEAPFVKVVPHSKVSWGL